MARASVEERPDVAARVLTRAIQLNPRPSPNSRSSGLRLPNPWLFPASDSTGRSGANVKL